ncbi:hypothetical protein LC605_28835 [Nostoc sp. CHAB 5836]|uniref:hypothetical protein n=1 Tax=Nostoc sp. CHAB 5836 TaxID=2780404 RepID=UPI001E3CFB37|nr:hypothetical protein [Nostoc sp. CHAB 5836]MCC5619017.1 hypothetical protein [Nostoc sp. CHAB 5836]
MNKQVSKDVELPRVKRRHDSWDGKTIEYLVNHQSKKSAGELTMEAVTSYWLIEALVGKVSKEEFIEACLSSIGQLEGKLVKIRILMQKVSNSFEVDSSAILPLQQIEQNKSSISEKSLPISTNVIRKDKEEQEELEQTSQQEESLLSDDDLGLMDLKMTQDLLIATQLLGFDETNGNKNL